MKHIKASIGLAVLLAGSLGTIGPSQATGPTPFMATSAVSVQAPDVVLTFDEVAVTTSPAPAPAEPVETVPVIEDTPEPVSTVQTPSAPVEEVPVSVPTLTEPAAEEVVPEEVVPVAPVIDYWETGIGGWMKIHQGTGIEANAAFLAQFPEGNFGSYRGTYVTGHTPIGADYTVLPSSDPTAVYVFETSAIDDEVLGY